MKNQNYITNIIILFITVFSIVISTFLWPIIKLPYSNPENVVGVLSLIKYSPLNDTLRYIVFVGIPILGCFNMLRNQVCEANLTIILWFIPNYFAGIRNAPVCISIVADTVEYLERNPVFIADIFSFNAFDE